MGRNIKIKLKSMEQVQRFVNLNQRFDLNFDITSGRRAVDGKSFLGVASLDLSMPLDVMIIGESDSEIKEYIKQAKAYIFKGSLGKA